MKISVDNLLAASLTASDHPNEMRFEGVLLRLDEPSSKPPNGSRGHRIFISSDVAKKLLKTLIGMGINYDAEDLNSHAVRHKVGVIKKAWIDGRNLYVSGVIWKRDFPEAEKDLKQDDLGMSFEASDISVEDVNADVWKLTKFYFTGATILKKSDAAYYKTSAIAAASAAEKLKIKIGGIVTMKKNGKTVKKQKSITASEDSPKLEEVLLQLVASQEKTNTILTRLVASTSANEALLAEMVAGEDEEPEEEVEAKKKVEAAKKKSKKDEEADDEDDDEEEEEDDEDDEDDEGDLESEADDEDELEELGEKDDDDDDDPGHLNKGAANKGDKKTVSTQDDENKNKDVPITGSAATLAAAVRAVRRLRKQNKELQAAQSKKDKKISSLTQRLQASQHDLQAAAEKTDRRSHGSTSLLLNNLLSKQNLDVSTIQAGSQKISVAEFDAILDGSGLDLSARQRVALKTEATRNGVMDEGFVTRQ